MFRPVGSILSGICSSFRKKSMTAFSNGFRLISKEHSLIMFAKFRSPWQIETSLAKRSTCRVIVSKRGTLAPQRSASEYLCRGMCVWQRGRNRQGQCVRINDGRIGNNALDRRHEFRTLGAQNIMASETQEFRLLERIIGIV